MMPPFVSVIVATRNRAAMLSQTLEALAGQSRRSRDFEIIVADNLSTDTTRAVVEAFAARDGAPLTRYLFVSQPGKSHAVNAAIAAAAGRLLAFTDDDVLPSPEWLDHLVAAFDDPQVDFATGRILPWWEADPPGWLSPELYGALSIPDNGTAPCVIDSEHPGVMALGGNLALRRRVVEHLGGLRADLGSLEGTLRTGEDHEFFLRMLRAGYRGLYVPGAVVRHFVPRTRLRPSYFREWLFVNGQVTARLDAAYRPAGVPRLLGTPRYMWRAAAADAGAVLRAALAFDTPRRFAASMRLVWFAGYLREAWRAPAVPSLQAGVAGS